MKYSDFIQVDEKNKTVVVKVNTKVFPMDIIYSAAYFLLDRAYVVLDGDPNKEVFVILSPRTFKGELEDLGRMFFDELIHAGFEAVQLLRNKDLKDALINALTEASGSKEVDEEDIATLWEEKFGESK